MDYNQRQIVRVVNVLWRKQDGISSHIAKRISIFILSKKRMLELFLERGAISQAQFVKSLHDLSEKMNVKGHIGTART